MNRLKAHWPLVVALLTFWAIMGALVVATVSRTGGHPGYVLDDAYIHLAIAKHLAHNGVWGITPYEFSSTSSSILWTLLLAGLNLVRLESEFTPLILNIVAGSLVLGAAWAFLRREQVDAPHSVAVLLGLVLLPSLPRVAFTGLEHNAQLLFCLAFIYPAARVLAAGALREPTMERALLLCAPFLTMVRFEGLFVLALVCVLLLLRRRVGLAFAVGALGVAPVVVFGLYSLSQGAYFLPNTLLAKAPLPRTLKGMLLFAVGVGPHNHQVGLLALIHSPNLVVALAMALVFVWRLRQPRPFWSVDVMILLLALGTFALHLQFARLGSYNRYEAYLVGLAVFSIGVAFKDVTWSSDRSALMRVTQVAVLAFVLIDSRNTLGLPRVPIASMNIQEQQVQMARFLRTYYSGQGVAANDIGAINYYADLHLLDVAGLGSLDIARAKHTESLTAAKLQELARHHNVKVAIIYPSWLTTENQLPPEWIPVAEWTIQHNMTCAGPAVTLYAVDPAEEAALREHVREFTGLLPKTVSHVSIPPAPGDTAG